MLLDYLGFKKSTPLAIGGFPLRLQSIHFKWVAENNSAAPASTVG
jgi:hypothetical protein